jgi:GNAT superfamily N-acetyltransferase
MDLAFSGGLAVGRTILSPGQLTDSGQNVAVQVIRTRPMTSTEFEAIRARMEREYADDHVAAGDWTAEEAAKRAAAETASLLPQGVDTPGVVMLVAENSEGDTVGRVWLALEHRPGKGDGAWIYDIEIVPEHRGQGFGRALLAAAEQEAARQGVSSIGLNVFGRNTVARSLYESAGYEVAAMQLKKPLRPGDELDG